MHKLFRFICKDDMVKGRLNYFKWKIEPTSKLCLPTKWTEISKNPIGFEFKLSLGPFSASGGCEHHYVRIIEKTKDVTGATSSITVEGYLGVYHETGRVVWLSELSPTIGGITEQSGGHLRCGAPCVRSVRFVWRASGDT